MGEPPRPDPGSVPGATSWKSDAARGGSCLSCPQLPPPSHNCCGTMRCSACWMLGRAAMGAPQRTRPRSRPAPRSRRPVHALLAGGVACCACPLMLLLQVCGLDDVIRTHRLLLHKWRTYSVGEGRKAEPTGRITKTQRGPGANGAEWSMCCSSQKRTARRHEVGRVFGKGVCLAMVPSNWACVAWLH